MGEALLLRGEALSDDGASSQSNQFDEPWEGAIDMAGGRSLWPAFLPAKHHIGESLQSRGGTVPAEPVGNQV